MLRPLAGTPGVKHVRAYHLPLEGHFLSFKYWRGLSVSRSRSLTRRKGRKKKSWEGLHTIVVEMANFGVFFRLVLFSFLTQRFFCDFMNNLFRKKNFYRIMKKFRNCTKKRCETSALKSNQELPQNTTEFNQKKQSISQKGSMNSAI